MLEAISEQSGIEIEDISPENPSRDQRFYVPFGGETYFISWTWLYTRVLAFTAGVDRARAYQHPQVAVEATLEYWETKEFPKRAAYIAKIEEAEQRQRETMRKRKIPDEVFSEYLWYIVGHISEQSGVAVYEMGEQSPSQGQFFCFWLEGEQYESTWQGVCQQFQRVNSYEDHNLDFVISHMRSSIERRYRSQGRWGWSDYSSSLKQDLKKEIRSQQVKRNTKMDAGVFARHIEHILDSIAEQSGLSVPEFRTSKPPSKEKFTVLIDGEEYDNLTWQKIFLRSLQHSAGISYSEANSQSARGVMAALEWYGEGEVDMKTFWERQPPNWNVMGQNE